MNAKAEHGALPELAWIPIERLSVDHRYQRTLDGKRSQAVIERITASFRWAAFQAILVTRAEGGGKPEAQGYLIIDGQHRVEAAKRCGIKHVPAVVVTATSLADQAAAFVRANTDRVAVNPFALHRARVQAGDPAAVAVELICKRARIEIPNYQIQSEHLKPGQTLALGTLAKLPFRFGEEIAEMAVLAVAGAYRSHPAALRAPMFVAVAMLLKEVAATDRPAWAKKIEQQLAGGDHKKLAIRAIERRARVGGTEAASILGLLKDERSREQRLTTTLPGSTIKPPTREQLMGRR